MAKNFQELRAGMSAKAKAASAAEHRRLVDEMSLYQLGTGRCFQTGTAHGHVCQHARQLPSGSRRRSGDSRGVSRWARCENHAVF
jgi:hypothetical protein